MKTFIIFTISCLASIQARPSFHHGHTLLEGVPNESHFSKLKYPQFDLIHLGTSVKNHLPPTVIEINKKEIVKEPKPYVVKVPVPVPHPVEVAKPYPVVETKIIKVPHPVPYEVIKKVPYPVHVHGGEAGLGGHFGEQQTDTGHEENQEGGYEGGGYGFGGDGEADQSKNFETQVGWVPLQMGGEVQQTEEQH